MKTKTLEYNKETGRITLNEYDEGFLESSNDVTDAVMTLALEKLYDDYGLDIGDELVFKREVEPNQKIKKILGKFEK